MPKASAVPFRPGRSKLCQVGLEHEDGHDFWSSDCLCACGCNGCLGKVQWFSSLDMMLLAEGVESYSHRSCQTHKPPWSYISSYEYDSDEGVFLLSNTTPRVLETIYWVKCDRVWTGLKVALQLGPTLPSCTRWKAIQTTSVLVLSYRDWSCHHHLSGLQQIFWVSIGSLASIQGSLMSLLRLPRQTQRLTKTPLRKHHVWIFPRTPDAKNLKTHRSVMQKKSWHMRIILSLPNVNDNERWHILVMNGQLEAILRRLLGKPW